MCVGGGGGGGGRGSENFHQISLGENFSFFMIYHHLRDIKMSLSVNLLDNY